MEPILPTSDKPLPGWIKRRHPHLEAAEQNQLYLAFRRRRRERKIPFATRFRGVVKTGVIIEGIIIALVAWWVVTRTGDYFLGALAAFWGGWPFYAKIKKSLAALRGEPLYVRDAASRECAARVSHAFLESYSGREVAEAVYMESLEVDVLIIRNLFVATMALAGTYSLMSSPSVFSLFLVLLCLILIASLFLTLLDFRVGEMHEPFKKLYADWSLKEVTDEVLSTIPPVAVLVAFLPILAIGFAAIGGLVFGFSLVVLSEVFSLPLPGFFDPLLLLIPFLFIEAFAQAGDTKLVGPHGCDSATGGKVL